jgi:hypothetical protein
METNKLFELLITINIGTLGLLGTILYAFHSYYDSLKGNLKLEIGDTIHSFINEVFCRGISKEKNPYLMKEKYFDSAYSGLNYLLNETYYSETSDFPIKGSKKFSIPEETILTDNFFDAICCLKAFFNNYPFFNTEQKKEIHSNINIETKNQVTLLVNEIEKIEQIYEENFQNTVSGLNIKRLLDDQKKANPTKYFEYNPNDIIQKMFKQTVLAKDSHLKKALVFFRKLDYLEEKSITKSELKVLSYLSAYEVFIGIVLPLALIYTLPINSHSIHGIDVSILTGYLLVTISLIPYLLFARKTLNTIKATFK